MANGTPYEVIMGPMELFWAPFGTAFPAVDEAPGVSWTKVGTSGKQNYKEDGVTVVLAQTLAHFRGLGSTLPIKSIRSEEDVTVSVILADMSLEQVRLALNNNAVTTTGAGAEAGFKHIQLYRGPDVAQMALLARGPSPYFASGYGQFELLKVVVEGQPEMVWAKNGEPVGVEIVFRAQADLTQEEAEQVGVLRAMTAIATS